MESTHSAMWRASELVREMKEAEGANLTVEEQARFHFDKVMALNTRYDLAYLVSMSGSLHRQLVAIRWAAWVIAALLALIAWRLH